jgi:alanine racemase
VGNGITLAVCEPANIKSLQVISAAMNTKARVHLKMETGLGRIGVDVADCADLAGFIEKHCPNIHLEGVFSHLAVSEDDAGAAFTEAQIALFGQTVEGIVSALGRPLELVHCANSGAILKYPNGWFSMVRTGQAAFGSLEGVPDSMTLQPCMSFFTRISFLKKVKRGTKISYGLTWEAHEDTWIGTMPVGWGDGFNRYFSNRGRVLLNGRSYPIVGTLSMDQSMIDLGADTDAQVGDEVVLVGRSGNLEITMMELAKALKTVPLEITSLIPTRVKRVYD